MASSQFGFGSQSFGPTSSQMGGGFTDNNMGFSQTPQKKQFQNQSLHPATFKQLQQVEQSQDGGNPMLDGKELSQIKVIGLVRSVQAQSTFIQYEMDDGTGMMNVKSWTSPEEAQKIDQNTYAVAFGKLLFYEGKPSFTAFSIRPVTDHNEVTFHMLEVMHAHRTNKNPKPTSMSQPNFTNTTTAGNTNSFGASNNSFGASNNTFGGNNDGFGGGSFGGNNNQFGGGNAFNGGYQNNEEEQMTPLQQQILKITMQVHTEEGIHFDQIVGGCQGTNINDVREAVEWLVNEGQLYSTIDDDHYKSTAD